MILDSSIEALPSGAGDWDVTRVLPREEARDSCHPQPNMNLCEKPAPSMGTTMIILIIAGAVALLCFLVFLYMLHRRRQRLDKLEDAKDLQELDDYGIKSMPKQQKTPPPAMPQAPPPTYERSQDRSKTDDNNWKRDSTDSLTPSLRQAMGVVPRDTLANK
ncbi:hypothetical protein FALBO_10132 [Fusarium albosuccineum]|uniref:Uncharacterized protein n=1 Tax=Fusarium albosuccineum TaxID=1237068 RepID=A0A8H4L841_9HYPO|nr:hypothetical protein FALBO_10132 [Fusarium albosuccineum]